MDMRIMPSLRAFAERHPRVVDGVVTLLVGVFCVLPVQAGGRGRDDTVGLLDWAGLGLLLLPLVWRRRAPVLVFWAVFGLAWLTDLTGADMPAILIVPLVAIYTIARHRPRRFLWPAAGAVEATMVVSWLLDDSPWNAVIAITALLAATVLLGVNVRTRRAYLAELEERARRLTRERDQQAQLAAAAERARIAREMHDIVAHNLAVMIALADGAAYTATTDAERAAGIMRSVSVTGRQALGEMRRLLGLLRDDDGPGAVPDGALSPQPGLDDIDALVDQVRTAGLRVALTREGVPGRWSAGAGLAVYRILQEALTNTLKHAGPEARAQVRLSYRGEGVDLEVTDDGGKQAPAEHPGPGHGLAGMAERAASYGGRLEAGPLPGGGWRVHARLILTDPLQPERSFVAFPIPVDNRSANTPRSP
jgi:signal transduction histidine kinase